MTLSVSPPPLLTTEQAAEHLHLSPGTLRLWRCTGKVRIPYTRIGATIRYRLPDLEAFAQRHLVDAPATTDSEPAGGEVDHGEQ